jgi:hypothetical protein
MWRLMSSTFVLHSVSEVVSHAERVSAGMTVELMASNHARGSLTVRAARVEDDETSDSPPSKVVTVVGSGADD